VFEQSPVPMSVGSSVQVDRSSTLRTSIGSGKTGSEGSPRSVLGHVGQSSARGNGISAARPVDMITMRSPSGGVKYPLVPSGPSCTCKACALPPIVPSIFGPPGQLIPSACHGSSDTASQGGNADAGQTSGASGTPTSKIASMLVSPSAAPPVLVPPP